MKNDVELKTLEIRAQGFQRALYDMFNILNLRAGPISYGMKIIAEEEMVRLLYRVELGQTQKAHRDHKVPFDIIDDSNTWLDVIENMIVDDVKKIIRTAVERRAAPTPGFSIH